LNYIFHSDITQVGLRSGGSISQVVIDSSGTGTGKNLITFHGDYTLIALHFYFINYPNALFSKISRIIYIDKKIQGIWHEKVALELVQKDKQVGPDTSSLDERILKPGNISQPLT